MIDDYNDIVSNSPNNFNFANLNKLNTEAEKAFSEIYRKGNLLI